MSTRLEGDLLKRHLVGMTKDKEKEERLAAALRENLRRRKTQSREMGEAAKDRKGED